MRIRCLGAMVMACVLLAHGSVHGACSDLRERVVRGRHLRCESAAKYMKERGADQRLAQALAAAPENRHELIRSIFRDAEAGVVAVIDVESEVWIARERWPDSASPLEVLSSVMPLSGGRTYWWTGWTLTGTEPCRASVGDEEITILVTLACCDTMPSPDACIVKMEEAAPISSQVLEKVVKGLAERAARRAAEGR